MKLFQQYDEGQRGITNIFGRLGRSYPQNIRESNFAGFSTADLINLSIHSPGKIYLQKLIFKLFITFLFFQITSVEIWMSWMTQELTLTLDLEK